MRSTRKQPFCWQEKKILRLLRKNHKGAELQKMRNLYLTITEIDSDFNNKDIKFYTKTISKYSGLSAEWIPTGLKKLSDYKIIKLVQEKEKGKFKGKRLVFTPENIQEMPLKTVIGKTGNGEPVIGKTESSEDILLLEDSLLEKDIDKIKNKDKKLYKEFVYLLDLEYTSLVKKYGKSIIQTYIENLNNYIGSKGKRYKSHYHTLLVWLRRDKVAEKQPDRLCPDCGTILQNDFLCVKCNTYVRREDVKYAS